MVPFSPLEVHCVDGQRPACLCTVQSEKEGGDWGWEKTSPYSTYLQRKVSLLKGDKHLLNTDQILGSVLCYKYTVLLCRQPTTYRCNSKSNSAHTFVSHLGLVCSHSNTPPSLLQVSPHYCIVQGPWRFSCTWNPFLLSSKPSLLSKFLFSNKTQLRSARAYFSTEEQYHAFPSTNSFWNLIFRLMLLKRDGFKRSLGC